jgi:hypothetical protein
MRVIVKTIKGETHPIECEENWQVSRLKSEILKVLSVDPDSQKLIFKGKHIEDFKIISELGIKDGDNLVLMIMKVS